MNKKESQALGVLGAGSWGTALALLTARAGRTVLLWSHHQTGPRIRSLGGLPLPDNVQVTSRFEELIEHNTDFVVAVPSHGFRPVLERFSQHLGAFPDSPRICWGTKGFEPDSGLLLSEVFDQVLGDAAVPAIWQFFRAEAPEDSMDPLAATDTLKVMPGLPKMLRNMDTTLMEEPLRKMINAPDMSHARESAVKVKTWAKDEVVGWPEEAVRRKSLELQKEVDLWEHPVIQQMSDNLCSFVVSRIAQDSEDAGLVVWSGDV